MRPLLPLVAVLVLAASPAKAIEEHVGRNAELGDPARWAVPADTPQEKYRTSMQEAAAAKAEALKECRAQAQRKACEEDARRRYESEVQRARAQLSRPGQE